MTLSYIKIFLFLACLHSIVTSVQSPNNTVSNSSDAVKAIFTGRIHKMSPRESVVYMAC